MSGYTYRSRDEVVHHIGIELAHEFNKDTYDALTHNCNHFSGLALGWPVVTAYATFSNTVLKMQTFGDLKQVTS